jgi:nitrate/nitrite-specific signal transduction histidine kinase
MVDANKANDPSQPPGKDKRRSGSILRVVTIRSRLLIAFVLMVLLAAIAISSVTVILGSRDARQRVIGQLDSVATLKEAEIESWVRGLELNLDIVISGEGLLNDVSVLTGDSEDTAENDTAYGSLRDRFAWAAERMGLFEELFLMDTLGRVVVSTSTGHEGERHSIYDYFIQGTEGHFIQQPSYSLSLGELTVVASAPVDVEGEALGVLAGRASLESLNQIMQERAGLGDTGETYLIGSNNRLLTGLRDKTYAVPETYILSEGAESAVSSRAGGSGTYRNYGEETVIGVYRWIPELNAALLAEQEEAEALHATRVTLMTIGGVAAGAVALAILASVVTTRSIAGPLADLAATARRVAAGDLDSSAKVERADEVGTVAMAFNNMTARLRDLVRSLEQRTDQLRMINEVGRSISSILSLDDLLPFVANSLQETFGYYTVNVLLVDPTSGDLTLRASAGGYTGTAPIGASVKAGQGIVGWVAENAQSLLANDVSQEPRYHAIGQLANTRSELAVPIRAGGDILGVLDIESAELDAFDEMDLFTAETLADQLAVAIRNAQLYEQAGELATVDERQRLARDLHDAVTQTLFSASIIAEVLPRLWDKDPADGKKRLEELRQLTRGALAEMRMLLLELRPTALTEVALGELLRQLAEAVTGRARLPIELSVEGQHKLPPDVQVTLYRIAQEAVNNIVKHAGASQARIELRLQPEQTELVISDDGSGFDPASVPPEHLGLGIMRERAEAVGARIEIDSQAGQGTKITVVW